MIIGLFSIYYTFNPQYLPVFLIHQEPHLELILQPCTHPSFRIDRSTNTTKRNQKRTNLAGTIKLNCFELVTLGLITKHLPS